MISSHTAVVRSKSMLGRVLLYVCVVTATLASSVVAQEKSVVACVGLHAAITGQVVNMRDGRPPYMLLTFVLLNDSENSVDTLDQEWKIAIDGKELEDSGWIFANGPRPVEGWSKLQPGGFFEFAKAMELAKYFPESREYRVLWKGKGFRSSTITVRVTPSNKDFSGKPV